MRRNQKLPLHEQIKADIDDEIYLITKRIEAHYNLSKELAISYTNQSIKELISS